MAAPVPVLRATDSAALRAAIDAIRAGELIGVPTETVYGIACALTGAAIDRLLEAKRRPASKGITLLVDDLAQAVPLAHLTSDARALAERFWPGPLTLVLPARPEAALPDDLTGGQGTVGFRMPDHPAPRALARALGPLPLTSANLSGEPDATTPAEMLRQLDGSLALVLDDGPSRGGTPSTVVAVGGTGEPRILRAGALPVEAILGALGRQ